MRFYYFIFYCLHSIIPGPRHIRDYRYIAGYLLTFLTVILVWTVYGLTVFQKPDYYSKPTFTTITIISFIVFGLINYRVSKSKDLFKTMIEQNKPTELKHMIWGWGLIMTTISAFATVVYLIRN